MRLSVDVPIYFYKSDLKVQETGFMKYSVSVLHKST